MDCQLIIASDHGGYDLKVELVSMLGKKGFNLTDIGTYSSESCDYPDFACEVGKRVGNGEFKRGIVICTSGIGVSICANKAKGARAALCLNKDQAKFSRLHNNANVLALGAKYLTVDQAFEICETWLSTDFEGGRHERRINKISEFEGQ